MRNDDEGSSKGVDHARSTTAPGITLVARPTTHQNNDTVIAVREDSFDNGELGNGEDYLLGQLSQSINSYLDVRSVVSRRFRTPDIPNIFEGVKPQVHAPAAGSTHNFLVFTTAGKLIYAMNGADHEVLPFVGVVNTILNYFQIDHSTSLKAIKTSKAIFQFLYKSPLLLMAQGPVFSSEHILASQLDFLYSYFVSSLSGRQLHRLFKNRDNFDLRGFLGQPDFDSLDHITFGMCNNYYPALQLNAMKAQYLPKNVRESIHDTMLKEYRESSLPRGTLLYGLIISSDQYSLSAVLRPKTHTLHTVDLHLLNQLIASKLKDKDDSKEFWVPICFPKFNPTGFLYCYIKFLPEESHKNRPVVVLISAQKDAFYQMKEYCDGLITKLDDLELTQHLYRPEYVNIASIGAPFVHHFVYKSKKHVQFVEPRFDLRTSPDMLSTKSAYYFKMKLYFEQIYASMSKDNGKPLNKSILLFIKWNKDGSSVELDLNTTFKEEDTCILGLGWKTPHFEIYLLCNNGIVDQRIAFKSAKRILQWCKRHESRLFISDGAIF